MKHQILKLIRRILLKIERDLDTIPKYKIRNERYWVKVHETEIYIHDKVFQGDKIRINIEEYFKIRDEVKSYRRKYEKNQLPNESEGFAPTVSIDDKIEAR